MKVSRDIQKMSTDRLNRWERIPIVKCEMIVFSVANKMLWSKVHVPCSSSECTAEEWHCRIHIFVGNIHLEGEIENRDPPQEWLWSKVQEMEKMEISRCNMSHLRIIMVTISLLLLIPCTKSMVAQQPAPSIMRPMNVTNSVFEESAKHGSRIGVEYPQCEWIPVTCQGLGYNMTAMPNLIGHTNLLDAEIMVNVFHLFKQLLLLLLPAEEGQFFPSLIRNGSAWVQHHQPTGIGELNRSTRCFVHCLTSCIESCSSATPLWGMARREITEEINNWVVTWK